MAGLTNNLTASGVTMRYFDTSSNVMGMAPNGPIENHTNPRPGADRFEEAAVDAACKLVKLSAEAAL
jgi:hypothetical protein